MAKFIPKEKLSKKAKKELAAQRRAIWAFSPVSKKIESKKLYNRNKKSHAGRDDYGVGFLRLLYSCACALARVLLARRGCGKRSFAGSKPGCSHKRKCVYCAHVLAI